MLEYVYFCIIVTVFTTYQLYLPAYIKADINKNIIFSTVFWTIITSITFIMAPIVAISLLMVEKDEMLLELVQIMERKHKH